MEECKDLQLSSLNLNRSYSSVSCTRAQAGVGRRSKHLDILKEIQDMSKKLKIISKMKTHQQSIAEGVEEENDI